MGNSFPETGHPDKCPSRSGGRPAAGSPDCVVWLGLGFYGLRREKVLLIHPWAAIGGLEKAPEAILGWAVDFTQNRQPSTQASGHPWLESGVSPGTCPFLPRDLSASAINMLFMVSRLFMARSAGRPVLSCPQSSLAFLPCSSVPRGGQGGGGAGVSVLPRVRAHLAGL